MQFANELENSIDLERRALTDVEMRAILHDIGWGVLSTVDTDSDGAMPYGVPVAYAYDGTGVYVACGPGRKRMALEENGRACLTVMDVDGFDSWRTVVVRGTASPLSTVLARVSAMRAFATQGSVLDRRKNSREASRLLSGRIFRVDIEELSGRAVGGTRAPHITSAATQEPQHDVHPPEAAAATRAMEGIRRLVRAIRVSSTASERAVGLSAAQLFALRQIALRPNQSLNELAKRTLTTQSSVSEVVTRLVDQGLVERKTCTLDRRRAELALTEEGRKVLAHAPETVQERLVSGYGLLAPEQQAMLAIGLESWLSASGLNETPATMFFEPLREQSPVTS